MPPPTLWVILQTCHCTCQSSWWFPMNEAKALPGLQAPTSLSAWASPSFPHLHPPLSLRSPPPPLQPSPLHSCLSSPVPQQKLSPNPHTLLHFSPSPLDFMGTSVCGLSLGLLCSLLCASAWHNGKCSTSYLSHERMKEDGGSSSHPCPSVSSKPASPTPPNTSLVRAELYPLTGPSTGLGRSWSQALG